MNMRETMEFDVNHMLCNNLFNGENEYETAIWIDKKLTKKYPNMVRQVFKFLHSKITL